MPELVPTLDEVFQATVDQSGLTPTALKMGMDAATVRWRHIGIYVARRHNYSSLKKIAKVFGYDNHSPSYYAMTKITGDFEKYEEDINAVKTKLGL
jgi:chromosomal replication initiation ATPase DnaA